MKRGLQIWSTVIASLALTLCFAGAVKAQSPVTAEGFADVNGARIFYTVTGSGEPLILIHGYPLSGDLFSEQRAALSQRFQVVTLDLRGFGRSTAPDDQASIDLYADDVLGLMDFLGIQRAVIGGHSMGGITTLAIYRRAPERFSGMILNATTAAPAMAAEGLMWRGYARQAISEGGASLLPMALPEFLTGQTRRSRPELVADLTNIIGQASLNGLVGGANALAERPDQRAVLPTIAVPTLILFGLEDSLTPIEMGTMLRAAIPNSQLSIVDGASHGVVKELPQQANDAILQWAAQNLGAPAASGN